MRQIIYLFISLAMLANISTGCKNERTSSSTAPSAPTTYKGDRIIKDVGLQEAKTLIANEKNLVILDVRTPEETKHGVIKGAIEIDFTADDFEEKIANLDKNVPYLVYCKAGGRSTQCKNYMETLGFPLIYNLKNGYDSWPKFD